MKAHFRTSSGRLSFEIEAEGVKAIFEEVAAVQEIFDAENVCGLCDSKNLRFVARQVDDFKFYEIACADCHARFAFGQAKKGGGLFPKRKDEDGNYLPAGGWSKYQKPGTQPTADAAPKAQRTAGVATFPSWAAAEASEQWGDPWLNVAGVLYKLSDDGANYNVSKEQKRA